MTTPGLLERLSQRLIRAALWVADRPIAGVHLLLVLGFAVGAVLHQTWLWGWYIEDAAISFAYARNLAEGEGLVPTPNGERLEGYSNPTWVALLAVAELLGFNSFNASKVLQAVLVFFTVPLTYLVAREASPTPREGGPVVAAGFLATSTTAAIWGASGLENALFSFLLAAALLRTAVDLRTRSFPYAAFLWFLLAITRPEAILYCAIAGGLTMLFTGLRGPKPTLQWLAAFFVPFVGYHALRFWYFAYEFPQTYYGKMTNKHPRPFDWSRRGWKYVREWAFTLWTGFYLPIWAASLIGTRGWRFRIGAVLTTLLGFTLLFPWILPGGPVLMGPFEVDFLLLPEHFPGWWTESRSTWVIGWAFTLPLLAIGSTRGWQIRVLCWGLASSMVFFAVYTMGDWMKAWRWMSLLQVPAAVLFGTGVGAIVDGVERGLAAFERKMPTGLADKALWAVVQMITVGCAFQYGRSYAFGRDSLLAVVATTMGLALVVGVLSSLTTRRWTAAGWSLMGTALVMTALPNFAHLKAQRGRPETGPFAIKTRVEFVRGVKKRLDLQHRIVDLDVDMGAHLWWGRDDFRMVDLAGLVDIPLAQHRFQRPFFGDYIFDEVRPDFAHVHGGWATNSKIATYDGWIDDYVEIPGYPAGATQLHIGNFVRRDLFMKPDVAAVPSRTTAFKQGWVLEDLAVPSEPGQGRKAWVKLAVRSIRIARGKQLPRVLVFASRNGAVAKVWDLPLTFDWLSPTSWGKDEVFVAGFPVPLDGQVPPGTYDLGLVLVGPDGRLLAPLEPSEDAPVFAEGEVRFADALTVVTIPELSRLAKADREEAIQHARKGRCQKAERAWDRSRFHRVHDDKYFDQHRPRVAANLARCWADYAAGHPERALRFVRKAEQWDAKNPRYLEVRAEVAENEHLFGLVALREENYAEAYKRLSNAVKAEPTRSWDRRWAEQARRKANAFVLPPEKKKSTPAENRENKRKVLDAKKTP